MKKQLTAIFAATIFACALAGCGTETRTTDDTPYYPTPTPSPTISPTPTPTPPPTPTPTPSPTETPSTAVKTIYYQAGGGNVTDICSDGVNTYYYPVSLGTSSKIMKYDSQKGETADVLTGLTKPFGVAYVTALANVSAYAKANEMDTDPHLFYTTREGAGGHIWDYNLITKTNTSYGPAKEGTNLIDPTYIQEYNGFVLGVDRANASRFGYVLDYRTNQYVPGPGSTVHTAANFFDGYIYTFVQGGSAVYRYFMTGSLSSSGGIGVFGWLDTGIKEVTETSDVAPYKSSPTSGKFITTLCEFGKNIIYSSFQEPGKVAIYTFNPAKDKSDEVLFSDGNIPAAYDIAVSRVNPTKFYFTACGTSGSQGVYVYDSKTKTAEKIAGPTTDQPMLSPAKIMITNRQDLAAGYEEIIWTCGGGYFDNTKGQFEGASGAVYSKVHLIGVPEE